MPQHRILFADDDPDTCELVTLVLREEEVICAFSVQDALDELMSEGPFDLYILDYYLPESNGLTLCMAIREKDQTNPVMFLTGSHSLQTADVKAVGAQYLVRKSDPNFIDDLKNHVNILLDPGTDVSAYQMTGGN